MPSKSRPIPVKKQAKSQPKRSSRMDEKPPVEPRVPDGRSGENFEGQADALPPLKRVEMDATLDLSDEVGEPDESLLETTEEELANYQRLMARNSALTEKCIEAFCSREGFPTVVIRVSMNGLLSR